MATAAPRTDEIDLAHVGSPMIATIGGLALIASGMTVSAAGAQAWVFLTMGTWWLVPVPYVLMGLGLIAMILGGITTRARLWAAIGGTLVGALMVVVCLAWTVFGLFNGLISGAAILGTLFAGAGALLMPFTLVPIFQADRARRALYA